MFSRGKREQRVAVVQTVVSALERLSQDAARARSAIDAAESEFPGIIGYDLWEGLRETSALVGDYHSEAAKILRRQDGES